jgi:S-adenosylhomocysteine hydrolase
MLMPAATATAGFNDYKVKDFSLADWGRKEIAIAETEMPGLMACVRNTVNRSRSRVRESSVACI